MGKQERCLEREVRGGRESPPSGGLGAELPVSPPLCISLLSQVPCSHFTFGRAPALASSGPVCESHSLLFFFKARARAVAM